MRVGRKWLFHREQIEALLGQPAARGASGMSLSARNHLRCRILDVRLDGLMAEVLLRVGSQDLVAVITRSSAERMALAVGEEVFAVIKSTEVMIGKEERSE